MKRLVLIDGNAILHRAYHALPPLATSKGELVNAVFGFCSMLLKVIADLKPTHLAVCFDRPEPTFRKKLFEGYQAKRPKMPEDLTSQLDLVHKVLEVMGIPIYERDGFEADDVIGTLAHQAAEVAHEDLRGPLLTREKSQGVHDLSGARSEATSAFSEETSGSEGDVSNFVGSPPSEVETIIVTGDRDILQLVGKNIKVYLPVKGLSLAKLYGEKEVKDKFGIKPKQMVDFKALVGDPSDNYPGVRGIGPKTAATLLKNFGTLDKIYDKKPHLRSFVNEKVVSALDRDKERVELAKKLAKIVTDVPVKLEFEKCRLGKLDKPKVKKLFERLEFRSLIPRLKGEKEGGEDKRENNTQLSLLLMMGRRKNP